MDHHRYALLEAIREGIQDVLTKHPELGPKVCACARACVRARVDYGIRCRDIHQK